MAAQAGLGSVRGWGRGLLWAPLWLLGAPRVPGLPHGRTAHRGALRPSRGLLWPGGPLGATRAPLVGHSLRNPRPNLGSFKDLGARREVLPAWGVDIGKRCRYGPCVGARTKEPTPQTTHLLCPPPITRGISHGQHRKGLTTTHPPSAAPIGTARVSDTEPAAGQEGGSQRTQGPSANPSRHSAQLAESQRRPGATGAPWGLGPN